MAAVKLSTTLIVVVAVSGLVGCVIVLFLIYKCCRRSKPAPLPPIQPLAHYREKESNYLPHPHMPRNSVRLSQFGSYGSDASLLKPSRKPSFQTDESHGTPSSSHNSFSVPPSPQTNATHHSSPLSVGSRSEEQASITQRYVPTTRQARSVSRARLRRPPSRINSIVSTQSTFTHISTRSVNAIRGVPHSTPSNFQIVLPTPLAPQLQNHLVLNPSTVESYEELVERRGIADGWTTTPGRITSRRSQSDQDLSTRGAPCERETGSGYGHRHHRSLDTIDQPGRSESQTQFRGRTSSRRSIQPQPPNHGDTAPSPQFLDNQTKPLSAASHEPSDGQAGTPPSQSPGHTPNLPLPQFVSHSLRRYTPSSSADTPTYRSTSNDPSLPPVPPSPLPQQSSTQPEHMPSHGTSSVTEPEANDSSGVATRTIKHSSDTP
ncbi:hypothetical protein BDM02DRAFT_3123480 [Thelephora ganbajun]|uniref:Uncharacterized protein n=1 Tax=Thelephora ganbajun TaxID=370292 RepID=A0ACB6Z1L7_THEGA|nr:hypothetical protein BDM02DRAFT_3123480 [Thelephora ganbajun]